LEHQVPLLDRTSRAHVRKADISERRRPNVGITQCSLHSTVDRSLCPLARSAGPWLIKKELFVEFIHASHQGLNQGDEGTNQGIATSPKFSKSF